MSRPFIRNVNPNAPGLAVLQKLVIRLYSTPQPDYRCHGSIHLKQNKSSFKGIGAMNMMRKSQVKKLQSEQSALD